MPNGERVPPPRWKNRPQSRTRLSHWRACNAANDRRLFDVEDEIEAKREALIEALERRMNQRSHSVRLFRIRWALV